MKTSTLLALASGLLQPSHAAVFLPFARQKVGRHQEATVAGPARRSDSTNAGFSYQEATYVVNVTVGTPGQPVSLQLSPSASNTFVLDARSEWCETSSYYYQDGDRDNADPTDSYYCRWGTFSPGNSTSYKPVGATSADDDDLGYEFSEGYDNGAYAYGDYMSDVLNIGGMAVANLTMGLVNQTASFAYSYMGVLGLGPGDGARDSLPDRLRRDGRIRSAAYALWVDDEAAGAGGLLFGAVDTARFEGTLARLAPASSSSSSLGYGMEVQVVGINASAGGREGPVAVVAGESVAGASAAGDGVLFTALYSPPDTVSILPTDVASQIWRIAGASYDDSLGMALVACSAADDATNFTMQLGAGGAKGPVVTARMSDLVVPAHELNVSIYYSYYYERTRNMCLFGIQNGSSGYYSSGSTYSLGSTLLRRTYSVFDLVNNEVAVAPVRFGATSTSNIVPFESYGASAPSSTALCVDRSCGADSGPGTGPDDDDFGVEMGGTRRLTGVLSVGALVGMSLGIALGCLALGLAGILIWRHRRNRSPVVKREVSSVSSAEAGEGAPVMSPSPATAPGADAPETEEAPQMPTKAVGKGKEPEVPEPHTPSGAGEAESTLQVDHGEGSSSRNV